VSLPMAARLARTVICTTGRMVVTLAALACVVGLGSVLAISMANRAGYQVLGMKTGSMRPAINPGDLVIARRVQPTDIRNGDVISFRAPLGSHAPYTHRVVRILYRADGPEFITQGDANARPDVWTVHYATDGWRVVHVLRHAGRFLAVEQSVTGRRLIAASVFIVTIALMWPVFAGHRRAAGPAPTHGAATAAPQSVKVAA
jgi:signal peptidase I